MPRACDESIETIHQEDGEVVHMTFGYDNTWLITYEPKRRRR